MCFKNERMKIKHLLLQNYRKFVQPISISFCNSENEINEKTLLLGNNGSGKSTVLQAIVSLIACQVRDNFKLDNIEWPGYEYRHLQTGKLPLKAEAKLVLSPTEIEATKDYAEQLKKMGVKLNIPTTNHEIKLSLDYQNHRVKVSGGSYQLSGYQYAKRLSSMTANKNKLFENVGNIYWYNEQRNSYNLSNLLDSELPQIDFIRSFLSSAYNYHLAVVRGDRQIKEGEFDFYEKIHSLYKSIFIGHSFVGSSPRFDLYEQNNVPDFYLYDGRNQYELSGMSAGERAIFPILMDFARWNINNSIIIIDEVELHLHPPLQQTFVKALTKLGHDNQFIITTHSNSIASMFDESENQIIRLGNE